jgi:hypothetical protein
MCLAMKSDEPGAVEITSGIPYDSESLGYELGIETKTVELGLSLFIKFKMIDIREGGLIEIINFSKHQDLDRIEYTRQKNRERQAKFREKNKSNALLTCESLVSTPIREDKNREDKNKKETNIQFCEFWDLYNFKTGKAESEKKWNKLKDAERTEIVRVLPLYISETLGKGETSSEFKPKRKNPCTFINQRSWEDYTSEEITTVKKGSKEEGYNNSSIGISFL